ncbi:MAG: V-type ATP synthase subunit F [Candidatus Anstonellales archaeon]
MDESKKEIVVVGDSATVRGFRLAGIDKTFSVTENEEGCKKIIELISQQDVGLIITTDNLVESCERRIKQKIASTVKPIIITVPGIRGPIEEEESISKLIKRALGISLNMGNSNQKEGENGRAL